jgi:hypothetical protein
MTGILMSGVFWGVILILIGVSFIVRVIFNIHFPVWRVIIAIMFIALGLQVMLGGWSFRRGGAVFGETKIRYDSNNENREYNVIFGRGEFDFTGIPLSNGIRRIDVDAVFGEAVVIVDANVPVRVVANAAFASARFPDGTMVNFGNHEFTSAGFSKAENYLDIRADVAFGSLVVRQK